MFSPIDFTAQRTSIECRSQTKFGCLVDIAAYGSLPEGLLCRTLSAYLFICTTWFYSLVENAKLTLGLVSMIFL